MDISANFNMIIQQLIGCLGIFSNRLFWLAVTSQFGSMIAKMIVISIQKRHFSFKYMFIYGGMPSSHTSFVMALVWGTAFDPQYGWSAQLMACMFVLTMIIISDAVRFRGAVDKINEQVEELSERTGITVDLPKHVAHKGSEVIGGVIFSFFYTIFFYTFFYGLFK